MTADWEKRLRDQGLRVTPQRQLVLEAVESLGHGTPEEILARVQCTASGVNLSTVYRALDVLENARLVTHAHIGHGAPTYHSVGEDVHIHLVCDECGAVLSVPASVAEDFAGSLESGFGFHTDIAHVSIHGLCQSCAAAQES